MEEDAVFCKRSEIGNLRFFFVFTPPRFLSDAQRVAIIKRGTGNIHSRHPVKAMRDKFRPRANQRK
jgi:hypothetical protein